MPGFQYWYKSSTTLTTTSGAPDGAMSTVTMLPNTCTARTAPVSNSRRARTSAGLSVRADSAPV